MEGCHLAAGMADTIAVGKGFAQNLEKSVPIPIIQEDGLLGIAPDGQVIKRPGELGAQGNVMKVRWDTKIKDLTPFITTLWPAPAGSQFSGTGTPIGIWRPNRRP